MHPVNTLPPIAVSCTDYNELVFALGFARNGESATFLKQELQRAALCNPDDLPNNVVALNYRVIFRLAHEPRVQVRLLVHPNNFLCPTTEVSALSPVGAALLGLRAGDVMPFVDGGERRELSVDAVGMRFVGKGTPRLKGGETPSQLAVRPALWPSQHAPRPDVRSEHHA